MSNVIRLNDDSSKDDWLSMNNGTMDVFIDMLIVCGSALAKTDAEKKMIVWLAEKDQSIVGLGTVGFDIVEMPWTESNFDVEKMFMIKVVQVAESGYDWSKLGYSPNESIVIPFLKHFSELVEQMTVDKINEKEQEEWLESCDKDDPVKCGFPRCEKHGILLSCFGCKICNAHRVSP